MIRTVLFAVALALVIEPASAQTARQAKAGEILRLTDALTIKATTGTKALFPNVKLSGSPFVVVIELDAGAKEIALSYKVTADVKSSDIYLTSGNQRFAPRAVMEDFPSWGSDNDKEVELVEPHDGGAVSLSFKKAGSVSILFDLPVGQAATPKKLSVVVRTLKPSEQEHSLIVSL